MIQKIFQHIVPLAGLLILVTFTLSLFWCGDPECLTGQSNEDCASLVCSLLDKHETASSASGSTNDCSCVCHLPTITDSNIDLVFYPSQPLSFLPSAVVPPSIPTRLVYRPPIVV